MKASLIKGNAALFLGEINLDGMMLNSKNGGIVLSIDNFYLDELTDYFVSEFVRWCNIDKFFVRLHTELIFFDKKDDKHTIWSKIKAAITSIEQGNKGNRRSII